MMKGILVRSVLAISLCIVIHKQFIPLGHLLQDSDGSQVASRRSQSLTLQQEVPPLQVVRNPLITRSQCGKSWDSVDLSTIRLVDPFIWSLSGGAEYRMYVNDILKRWEPVGLMNVVVVALDQETADHLCESGYESVFFDRPMNSYSKVVDAKFQVSKELSDAGINSLFIELDIFCRASPLSELMELESDEKHDLVVLGHNNNHDYTNIGMYYIRAAPQMSHFFGRLVEILSPSLYEKEYENENGRMNEWFDQNIFNWCLKSSQFPQVKMGNETNACKSINVTHKMVSNLVISSNAPPVLVEQTICIHPLMNSPFSSFRNKLAIAKTLGFDLTDIATDERLLKTKSGELTYFDNIRFGFHSTDWLKSKLSEHRFLYHFSAMVVLAKSSNRTLVLPHHLMTVDTKTLPVYSLVNMATVEKHVRWRWEVPSDIQDRSTLVVDESHQFENISAQVGSSVSQVCELEGLLFLKLGESNEVTSMMQNLTWCLDRGGRTFKYQGGRDWLCDDTLASSFLLPQETS